MTDAGYGRDSIDTVVGILEKRGLGRDRSVQVQEDALCLVFIDTQFDELSERLDEDKMVDVVAKTLAKMSPGAIARVSGLELSDHAHAIIAKASAFD